MNNQKSVAAISDRKSASKRGNANPRRGDANPRRNVSRKDPGSRTVVTPMNKFVVRTTQAPRIDRLKDGDIRVRHREFCRDLIGVTAIPGTFSSAALNPGRQEIFPWLSRLALAYESYKFNRLDIKYETSSSSTNGGTVAIAVEFDVEDAAPRVKSDLLAWRNAKRTVSSVPCTYSCSSEDLSKRKSYFVSSSATGSAQALSDVGTLYYYKEGMATAAQCGEIWFEYDIVLMTPQLDQTAYLTGAIFSGVSNAAPFASIATSSKFNGTVVSTGTTTSVTTVTFFSYFEGVITTNFIGTGLGPIAEGGTASIVAAFPDVGTSTQIVDTYYVVALPLQTYVITEGNTTITSSLMIISPNPGVSP